VRRQAWLPGTAGTRSRFAGTVAESADRWATGHGKDELTRISHNYDVFSSALSLHVGVFSPALLASSPGTLMLTKDHVLQIVYVATADKDTVINLTNHSYFNLGGNGSGSVKDQLLLVNADRYTPTGSDQIPTGEMAQVGGTPLDFRQMMPIGARLHSAFQQMVYARGYDHNFVLNEPSGGGMAFAARAYDARSGRMIDCFTTEPGVQIYTSNGMNGSLVGSSGSTYRQTEGFTLETQHFPDSPNKPNFPSTELKAGQEFRSTTLFRFATDASLPPLPR